MGISYRAGYLNTPVLTKFELELPSSSRMGVAMVKTSGHSKGALRYWRSKGAFLVYLIALGASIFTFIAAGKPGENQAALAFQVSAVVLAIWLLTLAYPILADAIIAIRRYPQIRARLTSITIERDGLKEHLDRQLNEVHPAAVKASFLKGRDSILGSLLAEASRAELAVAAVSVQDGQLQLYATLEAGAEPPPSSRFRARTRLVQKALGELEVVDKQPGGEMLILRIVDSLDDEYWEGVREQAVTREVPPEGLVLYRENFHKQMTRNSK